MSVPFISLQGEGPLHIETEGKVPTEAKTSGQA